MAVGDKLVNLDGLKAVFGSQKKDLSYVQDALLLKPHSTNWMDMDEINDNKELNVNGEMADNNDRVVTDYIPVKKGDVIYLTGIKNSSLIPYNNSAIVRLVTYTADKAKINKGSGNYPTFTNSYEVTDDGAAYCRLCYSKLTSTSTGGATKLAVMINTPPASVNDIKDYYDMSYEAVDVTSRQEISKLEASTALVRQEAHSENRLNPVEIQYGASLNANGTIDTTSANAASRLVSGFIPANGGDTVYLTSLLSSNQMAALSGVSIIRTCWYDADKTCISTATTANQLLLPDNEDIAYIRICFSKNASWFTGAKYAVLMFRQPSGVADLEPYYDIDGYTERIMPDVALSTWGDSLIRGGYSATLSSDTSIGAQLGRMIGTAYQNYGVPSQGTGEVAMRMGAVEVHVTLENNQIGSGDNVLTDVHVSRGNARQNLMQFGTTADSGVPCTICGVAGKFWNLTGTAPKFTPDADPETPIPVAPMTRVLVPAAILYPYTVIWAGKNDMGNAGIAGLPENMADMMSAMAEKVPHDRFVILGVTTSLSDGYIAGGIYRTAMDRYNKIMKNRFPANFIDIQAELMAPVEDQNYKVRGLELAGIAFGTDTVHEKNDAEALAADLLVPSLLGADGTEPDNIHLNEGGRLAVAKIICEFMKNKGWV